MKTKLKAFFIFVTALVVLCSCFININDDPSEPSTEKFEYRATFSGPVYNSDNEITSYQFMCYVVNRTGQTLENVKFEIDWYDPTGELITYDSVTIPRLEKGSRWPVGVIHKTASDITRLEGSTASIRYLSSSSDLSRYVILNVKGQVSHEVTPSYAHGTATNLNSFDVLDPAVYFVTETSSGIYIAEYGMVQDDGIMLANGGHYDFGKPLNPRAKTPSGESYFFAVGTRR